MMVGDTEDGNIPYFALVMLFTVLVWAWELYLSIRQCRRLAEPRPSKIAEIVTEARCFTTKTVRQTGPHTLSH